ncbi:MAG: glycosyltransferase family 2 protein [Anaerolineae bacterium]|nr:glycosyltransferase family 2 protein [Anaerolineae bacterium]
MNILIGIPAHNEEMTVGSVIEGIYSMVPRYDLAVVDDGSTDRTREVVCNSTAILVPLPCNLGYSNAIVTLLRYATKHHYDAVVLIDADGQHDPACLPGFIAGFEESSCDVLIGSRYLDVHNYPGGSPGRRIGTILFSWLIWLLTGKRIYDTTSGMKAINKKAIGLLLEQQFVDFHAEAISYLLWSGLTVAEYPIAVRERSHGASMYSALSCIGYPLSVLLMIWVSFIESRMNNRGAKKL